MASNGSARIFELLATAVRVVCSVIAGVLVAYAVFVFFGANPENGLVAFARGWRETFGWFAIDLFTPADPKIRETVNTAIAAVVWVVAGSLISKLIVRFAPTGKAKAEKKA